MANKNYYFKHYNNAHRGGSLGAMYAARDFECVAYFWLILELASMSEAYDNRGHFKIHESLLLRLMGVKKCRLIKCNERLKQFEIDWQIDWNGSEINFHIPNWQQYQENRGGKREAKKEQKVERLKTLDFRLKTKECDSAKDICEVIPQKIPANIVSQWEQTLTHYGLRPNWQRDESPLMRLFLKVRDWGRIESAIVGFRNEEKSDKYDPARHCNVMRMLNTDKFVKLETLGAFKKEKSWMELEIEKEKKNEHN